MGIADVMGKYIDAPSAKLLRDRLIAEHERRVAGAVNVESVDPVLRREEVRSLVKAGTEYLRRGLQGTGNVHAADPTPSTAKQLNGSARRPGRKPPTYSDAIKHWELLEKQKREERRKSFMEACAAGSKTPRPPVPSVPNRRKYISSPYAKAAGTLRVLAMSPLSDADKLRVLKSNAGLCDMDAVAVATGIPFRVVRHFLEEVERIRIVEESNRLAAAGRPQTFIASEVKCSFPTIINYRRWYLRNESAIRAWNAFRASVMSEEDLQKI